MHWQDIAALAIVAITVALFVRGFLKRSPSACGRNCACPSAVRRAPGDRDVMRRLSREQPGH
jgi:hypothetical protein